MEQYIDYINLTNEEFSVVAEGTNTYQWQQLSTVSGSVWTNLTDGATFGGTTTATLIIYAPVFEYEGYQYRCIVTNSCFSTTSDPAALLPPKGGCPAPVITTQPADALNVCIGSSQSFTVGIGGAIPSHNFQWYKGSYRIGSRPGPRFGNSIL